MSKSNKLFFDIITTCQKCGRKAGRLAKTGSFHHFDDEDYRKCGYVKLKKEMEKFRKTFA